MYFIHDLNKSNRYKLNVKISTRNCRTEKSNKSSQCHTILTSVLKKQKYTILTIKTKNE